MPNSVDSIVSRRPVIQSPLPSRARVHIEFPSNLRGPQMMCDRKREAEADDEEEYSLGSTDSESSSYMYSHDRSQGDIHENDEDRADDDPSLSSEVSPRSESPGLTDATEHSKANDDTTEQEDGDDMMDAPILTRFSTWPLKETPSDFRRLAYLKRPILAHPSRNWTAKSVRGTTGKETDPKMPVRSMIETMNNVKISSGGTDDDESAKSRQEGSSEKTSVMMTPGSHAGSAFKASTPSQEKPRPPVPAVSPTPSTKIGPCDRPKSSVQKVCKSTGKVLETFETAAAASKDAGCKYASTFRRWLQRGSCEYNGFYWKYATQQQEVTCAPPSKRCGARVATPVEKICKETGKVLATFKSKSDACRSIGMQTDGYLRTLLQNGTCEYKGFLWRSAADVEKVNSGSGPEQPKKFDTNCRAMPVVKICMESNKVVETFVSVNAASKSAGYKSRSCFFFKLQRGDCFRDGYRWAFASVTEDTQGKRPHISIETSSDDQSTETPTCDSPSPKRRKLKKYWDKNDENAVA